MCTLPAGLTEEMRDVAWCLFEAMALLDSRRARQPGPGNGWACCTPWRAFARTALAAEKGGKAIYLAKGVAAYLSARDLQMCGEFRGNNYDALARKWGLTEMRVRQIVSAWQDPIPPA